MVAIGPLLLGCCKNIPVLYYYHSPWHEEFLTKKLDGGGRSGQKERVVASLMRLIEKRILLKTSRVIVLSQFMGDRVSSLHHYPADRIIRIPGGVDLKRFNLPEYGTKSVKIKLGIPLDKTIFLTVRNLVPRMGLEELIEAFNSSRILKNKGLLLIGGKGHLENRLKSLVKRYNLYDAVRFLGHIPEKDLPQMYQAADLLILPTKELEGFGLVILEALACGTPVLGTPVGAIPEVIGSFGRRLIFNGTSCSDIKKKMEELIERLDIYNFDPKVCRKFVVDNFSWKKVADDFEKVAMELICGNTEN